MHRFRQFKDKWYICQEGKYIFFLILNTFYFNRFEGQKIHYAAWGNRDMLPKSDPKMTAPNMDESEAVTRIMHVLHTFGAWNLNELSWTASFDS